MEAQVPALSGHGWLWWVIPAAVVLTAWGLWPGQTLQLSRAVVVQFILTIALPVLILLGLPLVLLGRLAEFDPRVWQALIAGLVLAAGWLTQTIFREIDAVQRRAESLRDYHKAIYAEIANNLNTLWNAGAIDDYARGLIAKMQADPAFVPFIPKEQNDHVYDAIIERIDVLPRQTIDAIVAYYSQVKSIAALAEDMRGDAFRQMSQDRRIAMYSDYVEMKKTAFVFGTYANAMIRAYASGGAAAAEAEARRINSRAEDPSGPRSGST